MVERSSYLSHHPVRSNLLVSRCVRYGHIVVGNITSTRENAGIIFRKTKFLHQALAHFLRQFRHFALYLSDPFIANLKRQQIWIREIAIVH